MYGLKFFKKIVYKKRQRDKIDQFKNAISPKPQQTLQVSQWFLRAQTLLYTFYVMYFHANPREIYEIHIFMKVFL